MTNTTTTTAPRATHRYQNFFHFSVDVPETAHHGHAVRRIRLLTPQEADPEVGTMWKVVCDHDRQEFDAWAEELTPVSLPDNARSALIVLEESMGAPALASVKAKLSLALGYFHRDPFVDRVWVFRDKDFGDEVVLRVILDGIDGTGNYEARADWEEFVSNS